MSIPIIRDVEEARATVLKRVPFDDVTLPPRIAEHIQRAFGSPLSPTQVVQQILRDVHSHGDRAVIDYTQRIDGITLSTLRVSAAEIEEGWEATPAGLRRALQVAANRIRTFHESQPVQSWINQSANGGLGQLIRPMARAGVYVPGGTASYPSSILMAAIPARVAGVPEVIVATPPNREGKLAPVVLAAARLAQVSAVYKMGGAQAIGALAYGTETVPRVDKIVGPGNLFVVLAKRQVFGQVGIDGLPGPTETVIIADQTARPAWVAADLIAQAEHDVLATAILLTPSADLALRVQAEVANQLAGLARQDIAVQSLSERGAIVLTRSVQQAVDLANEYAPEHMCLAVEDPPAWIPRIRNAGGLFMGEMSSEALGDYVVGPSHIMPTGGTARFASAVNVMDFVKIINVFGLDDREVRVLSAAAADLATAEGLTGHAAAIRARLDDQKEGEIEVSMAPVDVSSLIRSDVAGMEEYTPIVPFDVLSQRLGFAPQDLVKIDANENPYGPSPRAVEAMCTFPFVYVYPDPNQAILRAGLEKYIGVDRSHILCGNGSDELIDVILRLFIGPGDAILNCPPTFGMYSFLAQIAGARQVDVPRRADFSIDLEAIEAEFAADAGRADGRIKLVVVCQPNNPDGSLTSRSDFERLLRLPAVIVVDEAYAEFSGESIADWAPRYPNLIVLRTFSKWAGLAGLRLGYGLFPHDVIKHLWKIKQPYNINVAAQAAALASIEDVEYLQGNVCRIVAERERLFGLLGEVPYLFPYPSRSNFILCRVRDRDAQEIRRALEKQGILIRYFHKPGLTDCIRISVGTPAQSNRLLDALQQL